MSTFFNIGHLKYKKGLNYTNGKTRQLICVSKPGHFFKSYAFVGNLYVFSRVAGGWKNVAGKLAVFSWLKQKTDLVF